MNFKIKLNLTKSNSKTIFNLLQKYVRENEKSCLVRFENTQSDGLGTLTEMFYPETDEELLDYDNHILLIRFWTPEEQIFFPKYKNEEEIEDYCTRMLNLKDELLQFGKFLTKKKEIKAYKKKLDKFLK